MTEGYTFAVSNVPGNTGYSRGKKMTAKQSLENMLQEPSRDWRVDRKPVNVEAMSNPDTIIYDSEYFHGLLSVVHRAFDQERRLILSPDAIWLTITQGFARHINQNAEEYRQHFVQHEGKKTIQVRRDEFLLGSPDNDWPGAFGEFSQAIKAEIGEKNHANVISDFSTTDAISRAVSEIVLMDAMQSYFRYEVGSMCGIPEVTLEGTVEDWDKLASKVEALKEYGGLDWWLNDVGTIAKQMAAARRGNADTDFWQNIYNFHNVSGGPYVSGWIIRLIPYLPSGDGQEFVRNRVIGTDFDEGESVNTDDFPRSLSRVPFVWKYHGAELDYEFIGGLIGATEESTDSQYGPAVRPVIGWAVRPVVKPEDGE